MAEAEVQRGSYDLDAREPAGYWCRSVSCDRDACRRRRHWARVWLGFQNCPGRIDQPVVSGPLTMTVLLEAGDREWVVC